MRQICPYCNTETERLGTHIRAVHGDDRLVQIIVDLATCMRVIDIAQYLGISYRRVERVLIAENGHNLAGRPVTCGPLVPAHFQMETTSIWSFPSRGSWATHNGNYRGNWSPYIPRNLILRYSQPGDVILDPFVGGGTTAVESKLLGRSFIGVDINPAALERTKQVLEFPMQYSLFDTEPDSWIQLVHGDVQRLPIRDESVRLICAHPPYANIIQYSNQPGDLSHLTVDEFVVAMDRVYAEMYRVLQPGGYCAVLITNTRNQKRTAPLGLEAVGSAIRAGFTLDRIVIKAEHQTQTNRIWYHRSLDLNILLKSWEQLIITRKCSPPALPGYRKPMLVPPGWLPSRDTPTRVEITNLWQVDDPANVHANLDLRYKDYYLLYAPSAADEDLGKYAEECTLHEYAQSVRHLMQLATKEFVIAYAEDIPAERGVCHLPLIIHRSIPPGWHLREFVVLWYPEPILVDREGTAIVHQYLMVYQRKDADTLEGAGSDDSTRDLG